MDAPPSRTNNGQVDAVADPPIHLAVWVAFAACGFLVVLMSGIAAVLLAILVQREAAHPKPEIAAVVAPAPAPEEVGAEVRRQGALQAIRDGDYDRAVVLTTEALAVAPGENDLEELLTIAIDLRDRKTETAHPEPKEPEEPRRSAVSAPTPRTRAPARPRPEVDDPGVGVAVITSSPKGLAFEIPGVVRGETPYRAVDVPVGSHDVIFYIDGLRVHSAKLTVPRGGVELVDVNLERQKVDPIAVREPPTPPVTPVVGPTTVYVFVRSTVKPRVIGQALQSQLPGMTVTAFGTFRDFDAAMKSAPPDAVIASQNVLDALRLPTHLQGRDAAGSSDERYVLLGKRSLAAADLATSTIGTVDVAGRESSAEFVARLLEAPKVAQVKRVSEEADLLPLLQIGAADAILVPESLAPALIASTQMDLTQMTVASGSGLPGISVLDSGRRTQIEGALRAVGPEFNARIGVASWGSE